MADCQPDKETIQEKAISLQLQEPKQTIQTQSATKHKSESKQSFASHTQLKMQSGGESGLGFSFEDISYKPMTPMKFGKTKESKAQTDYQRILKQNQELQKQLQIERNKKKRSVEEKGSEEEPFKPTLRTTTTSTSTSTSSSSEAEKPVEKTLDKDEEFIRKFLQLSQLMSQPKTD